MRYALIVTLLSLAGCASTSQQTTAGDAGDRAATGEQQPGFLPFELDPATDRLSLSLPPHGEEFLYLVSLPRGVGSNDIGLDRGQLGNERILRVERHADRVLLVEPNLRYQARQAGEAEARAVRDSFAESVIWGFELLREEEGRLVVDATDFLMRDAYGIARNLSAQGEAELALDRSRSVLYRPMIKAFPDNTEVEVRLTFAGRSDGQYLWTVAPDPDAVTVHLRHSFIRLPGPGYEPLPHDERAGAAVFYTTPVQDYAVPIQVPLSYRYAARHRLQRTDPAAASSPAVEPIVYHLDPGTPEPIRSALLDGARWWAEAFEAAGYEDAFRVEVLPEDADPMDVRYNVIQWVHRSTRGWSYGDTVVDPRTGEIIKGHVTLGSLRVRQDFLIAQGLLSPYTAERTDEDPMVQLALARLRQLSAHEVGHTLGFAHNFMASSEGRASVLDYPHPLVELTASGPDLADAYDAGIGLWDRFIVRYAYSDFPSGVDPAEAREMILREAWGEGLYAASDEVARPVGGAHPAAHLWDNGEDPVAELERLLELRGDALARFGPESIPLGTRVAQLEEVLVPVYLMHRYQVEAAVKLIAGQDYRYQRRGDGQPGPSAVPADDQRRALAAMIATLDPAVLAMPDGVRGLIPPRPTGMSDSRETFPSRFGPVFDPIAAAEVATDHSLRLLLDGARASRLAYQSGGGTGLPGLGEVIASLLDATMVELSRDDYHGALRRMVAERTVQALERLAVDPAASAEARAMAWTALEDLVEEGSLADGGRFGRYLQRSVENFLDDPEDYAPGDPLPIPAGSPIGGLSADMACGWEPRA